MLNGFTGLNITRMSIMPALCGKITHWHSSPVLLLPSFSSNPQYHARIIATTVIINDHRAIKATQSVPFIIDALSSSSRLTAIEWWAKKCDWVRVHACTSQCMSVWNLFVLYCVPEGSVVFWSTLSRGALQGHRQMASIGRTATLYAVCQSALWYTDTRRLFRPYTVESRCWHTGWP